MPLVHRIKPFTRETPAEVLDLVDRGAGRLSGPNDSWTGLQGRLLCIDGPAGAGKSTLAANITQLRPDAVVVHLDDLLAGWRGGLRRVASDLVADVLAPLAAGRAAAYRRFDWHAGRLAERVPVCASPLLVVEGVGAGSRITAPYRNALVWIEAPRQVRKARGLARDGETFAPHWDTWAGEESEHFAAEATRSRADLRLTTYSPATAYSLATSPIGLSPLDSTD